MVDVSLSFCISLSPALSYAGSLRPSPSLSLSLSSWKQCELWVLCSLEKWRNVPVLDVGVCYLRRRGIYGQGGRVRAMSQTLLLLSGTKVCLPEETLCLSP